MDAAEPDVPSRRKRRALALAAGAAVVVIAASVAYLRPSAPAPAPTPGLKPVAVNPIETSIDFATYEFASPSVAWALHHPQSAIDAGPFWVSRTVDGGAHWQVRLRGQGSYGGFTIRFFDPERGFVVVMGSSPLLYRTSNGGDSWTRLSLPVLQVGEAIFTDASHGWLVVHPEQSQKVYLFATEDAGDSWRRLPDPPDSTYVLGAHRSAEMWLASSGLGPPRVYRSVDGGLSWQSRELPHPADEVTQLGSFWSTFVTLLPGVGVHALAQCLCSPSGRLDFTSFDGGATWRSVSLMPGSRPHLPAFQDDSHWWTIDARTLYRSSDAGQTWTRVEAQLPDWEFAPRAIDMTHAWSWISVTGGYGLARTDDAGLHWTRAKVPQST